MRRSVLKALVLIVCGFLQAGALSAGAAPGKSGCHSGKPLVFGFLPLVSAEKLVARFAPLVNYLSMQLDTEIYIETAPDFTEFIRRTNAERRYDLLFTAPHFFYQARRRAGYQLLASVDSPGMPAIIVAPASGPVHTVSDLRNRKLATTHPLALATLLVRRHLLENGINPDSDLTLVNTPTHNASLLSSYYGVTDASALMMPPFQAASAEVRDSMRIVAITGTTPHIPISAGPWVDASCKIAISAILVGMNSTPEGLNILKHIKFKGFVAASPDNYDQLEWAADLIEPE
ncbi:MAG: phosphate/phosphite/phosphonate ABC transporter substrate-binding protein [Gammaproteobacteria bacterium]